ncbi:MAG TPA: ABC transporter ATP-binding protein [Candidatus Paceibacterota bacterium]|nr:ABC transporter ATP-binding protein [Candidatus Paceibacterota bacterium]
MHTERTKAAVLEVSDLQVRYGDFTAVDGVSFSVNPGEIFGLLGPNGAGKTSTLSAIEGLLSPSNGSVSVAGFDIFKEPLEARANIGIQLQFTSFQQDLSVREIVRLYASLYGTPLSDKEIDDLLQEIKLEGQGDKRARELSGGQQQRLSLSIATIHNPPLVLLDEPTSGLDPQSRRQLWERVEKMRDSGRSVLLTTHSMEEAKAICERVAIVDHGVIVETGNPQELIDKYRNDPDVLAVSRGEVTLEDVFIGLTGKEVRV